MKEAAREGRFRFFMSVGFRVFRRYEEDNKKIRLLYIDGQANAMRGVDECVVPGCLACKKGRKERMAKFRKTVSGYFENGNGRWRFSGA